MTLLSLGADRDQWEVLSETATQFTVVYPSHPEHELEQLTVLPPEHVKVMAMQVDGWEGKMAQ